MIIIEERHDNPDRSVAVNGWIFDQEFKCSVCGTRYQLETTDRELSSNREQICFFTSFGIRPLYRHRIRNTFHFWPEKGAVQSCFAHCPICWENNLISKPYR